MGFRKGGYATVWEVNPKSDLCTVVRLSTSKKDKTTDEYETDFSGFVSFVGTNAAKKAANLSKKDRIKIGDCDVTTRKKAGTDEFYTNFAAFDFEKMESRKTSDITDADEQKIANVKEEVEEGLPF